MTRLIDTRLSRRAVLGHGVLALGSTVLPSLSVSAQEIGAVMDALSRYMAAAKDRALPANVAEKAKHHVLDTLAAMVSGSELPPGVAALALARAQAGRPVATVVG
jgi:ABC-type lipopolysaccharide export system ATPase subunit